MKKKLATSHKLIFDKIVNRTHSHSAFSKYVINIVMNVYFIHVVPVVEHNFVG